MTVSKHLFRLNLTLTVSVRPIEVVDVSTLADNHRMYTCLSV